MIIFLCVCVSVSVCIKIVCLFVLTCAFLHSYLRIFRPHPCVSSQGQKFKQSAVRNNDFDPVLWVRVGTVEDFARGTQIPLVFNLSKL